MTPADPALRRIAFTFGLSLLVLPVSGCVTHHHHDHSRGRVHHVTVPPVAPAHGTIHHYDGVVLVFDRAWGGYRIRDRANHYFYANVYFRFHDGAWQRCARLGDPWVRADLDTIPVGLRKRHVIREERRDARQERREERRETRHERREDRHEARSDRREERREDRKRRRGKHGLPANQDD